MGHKWVHSGLFQISLIPMLGARSLLRGLSNIAHHKRRNKHNDNLANCLNQRCACPFHYICNQLRSPYLYIHQAPNDQFVITESSWDVLSALLQVFLYQKLKPLIMCGLLILICLVCSATCFSPSKAADPLIDSCYLSVSALLAQFALLHRTPRAPPCSRKKHSIAGRKWSA